ncbi:hypothetical protein ACFL0M_07780 [Thermodesulfobacteriota bacterium]
MKNVWKKPELVVLYRGRPEEDVLLNCKRASQPGSPQSAVSGCEKLKKGVCNLQCNQTTVT